MANPSFMHSPYRRLAWAFMRLDALSHALKEALNPDEHPVTFEGTFDAEASVYEVSIGTVPEPPWFTGVMVGDVLHNLRSALDNAAWRLVQDGSDPTPTQPKLVAFPICSDPKTFKNRVGTALPGVEDRRLAVIEAAQPYKDAPVGAALASLQSLSNDDKHHDIHTVVVGTAGLDLEFHRVNATIVGSEPLWRVMDRPPPLLEERMGVFRFTLGDVSDDPHVNVSGRVTPYAGFDDRAPVLSHLAHLADAVRDLLGQLDEDVPALVRPPDWAPG